MGWQLFGTGHGHSHGGSSAPAHGHAHSENMNVRAAFIHVLGDVVQSIGVFCAAIVIYFKPEWQLADPICTFIFSIIVLYTTVTILKDAVLVSTKWHTCNMLHSILQSTQITQQRYVFSFHHRTFCMISGAHSGCKFVHFFLLGHVELPPIQWQQLEFRVNDWVDLISSFTPAVLHESVHFVKIIMAC